VGYGGGNHNSLAVWVIYMTELVFIIIHLMKFNTEFRCNFLKSVFVLYGKSVDSIVSL